MKFEDLIITRHGAALVVQRVLAVLACALCFAAAARAQVVVPTDSAPPRKDIPAEDRAKLSEARSIKERVKLTLQLAEGKLQLANSHTEAERFVEAGSQLGIYQALVEDLVSYVKRNGRDNNGTRDTFKRIELTLRSHVPRLETLRRITPSEEAVHVRDCIEFVRDARSRALESFFDDDSVLRMPPEPRSKDMKGGSAKNAAAEEPEKKPDQRR